LGWVGFVGWLANYLVWLANYLVLGQEALSDGPELACTSSSPCSGQPPDAPIAAETPPVRFLFELVATEAA
jgi:hypothetical protein